MKTRSLARRLIATVLLLELLSALGIVGIALAYERHTRYRAFDVMLRGRADSLFGAVGDAEDVNDSVVLSLAGVRLPPNDIFRVSEDGGAVLGQSANWRDSLDIPPGNDIFRVRIPDGVQDHINDGINDHRFRFIRIHRIRVVDPGDKDGGKVHHITVLYGASTEQLTRDIREAVAFYAIASSILIVTGLVMAWLLQRGLLPLRQLAAQAEDLAPGRWDFHPPPSALRTRELAPLTHSLEAAVLRLERSFKQQDRFLSDAAHELKTAVALIKSSLQLLGVRPRTAQEYEAGLERSLIDCNRMESIVRSMLTLARTENARTQNALAEDQPKPATADLTACAAATLQDFATMAELRHVTLNLEALDPAAGGPTPVSLAPEDCSLLLSNLILNAIQHSPAGAAVRILITQATAHTELQIIDQGEGIPPESLPHVFERFYRSDPSRQRGTGGSGLGLAICKAIVDKAHGAISLESHLGQGTTVHISLP